MAEYRLSPAAERDVEGIWKYTRGEWGIEQAERYTDLLTADETTSTPIICGRIPMHWSEIPSECTR
jgi:hypothetical protein